jgi:penicillin-binding protein 2
MAIASGVRHSGLGRQPVWLLLVVLLFSGAMVTRLAWLQLLHGAENRQRADENRIRLMPRNPIRGRLLDRHGRVLATSRLTYNLYVQPREVSDEAWPALRDRLASLLGLPADQLDEQRRSGGNREGFRVQLAENLRPDQVLRFRERSSELPGAEVDVDVLRSYPHGRLGAHVLGYTSGITEEEYNRLRDEGYRIRDRVGRSGVEKMFEAHLRGEWGGQQVEVNAAGQVQRVLGERPARAGKDLRLTLDLPLQQAAEKALDGVGQGGDRGHGPQHRSDPGDGQPAGLRSQHLLPGPEHQPVGGPQRPRGTPAQPHPAGLSAGQHLQDRHQHRGARIRPL